MALFTKPAADVFAPTTAGGALRGAVMGDAQTWGIELENAISVLEGVITAFTSNGGLIYSTKAAMLADLAHDPNTMAWVISDSTTANNGVYQKSGASGIGTWVRKADLPYSFIRMTDVGAGTANAIQVTSAIPTSSSVLRVANVFEANAGNVTLSENGAAAKPLLTSSGNQIAPGGLVAGMMIIYLESSTNFRLLSDQASAAIQAACEAAQAGAEAAEANALAAAAAIAAAPQWSFPTKAAAELFNPAMPPDFILLTGFSAANQFGGAKLYKKVVSMPSHGGKVTIGSTYYEPDTATAVTPEMYGGSLSDALTQGLHVHLMGARTLSSSILVSKSKLKITCDFGASITYTGSLGAEYVLYFNNVDNFDISGTLLIDCASKAGVGLTVEYLSGATAHIRDVKVRNCFQAAPAVVGAVGIQVYSTANGVAAAVCDIQWCDVEEVSRSVSGGVCAGISATDARIIKVSNNRINRVRCGNGNINADGLKVFAQLQNTGAYMDCVAEISNNFISNFAGRAIKTEVEGSIKDYGNLIRIDEAVTPISSFRVIDHQTGSVDRHDNTIELLTALSSAPSESYLYHAQLPTAVEYAGKAIKYTYHDNKALVTKAFADSLGANGFNFIFALNVTNLATIAATVDWVMHDEIVRTEKGAANSRTGNIAWYLVNTPLPANWASGALLNFVAHDNYIEANNSIISLGTSGGTAAHGGLGDLTGKLTFTMSGNEIPKTSALALLAYTTNHMFTSSLRIGSNRVGTRGSWVEAPFDYAKLQAGTNIYLSGASSPARANLAGSEGSVTVIRDGIILTVDNLGTLYKSRTEVGTTPSWTTYTL